MIHTQQIWMDYHTREITKAEQAMRETHCPVAHAGLLAQIEWHRIKVRQLDREAQAADQAARQDSFLVRT